MAISRAEIERRRQEAAHARATGSSSTVRRRCMIEGCPTYLVWLEHPDAGSARREQEAHYLAEHYVPGGPPVPHR